MRRFKWVLGVEHFILVILAAVFLSGSSATLIKNGFDLRNTSIPVEEIHRGGPPKDGIPAINSPKFVSGDQQVLLKPNDRVLGLDMDGVARAYPISILNWHEVVNDHTRETPVAVTFCPLCGTGMAFRAGTKDEPVFYGVSGLLYQSDVLLYDRVTESLWSQLLREAVSGAKKGAKLTQVPLAHTTWQDWLDRYPDTFVLSRDTGVERDYSRNPYLGYEQSEYLYFDVNHRPPPPYHPKERVMGMVLDGKAIAFPFSELSKNGKRKFGYLWQGKELTVIWQDAAEYAEIKTADGRQVATTIAFWFAWHTFHPNGEIFKAKR